MFPCEIDVRPRLPRMFLSYVPFSTDTHATTLTRRSTTAAVSAPVGVRTL